MNSLRSNNHSSPAPRRARGFTLIELVVTVTMIAIMLGLAAPNLVAFQRNSELTSVANSMLASLSSARAEAMKRARSAYVVPADGSLWSSGWIVFVDMDNSQSLNEAIDTVLMREPALPGKVVAVTGAAPEGFKDPNNGQVYVMFNGSGYPRLKSGGFQSMSLDLDSGGETRRIITSPAGRMRVCKPADTGCSAGTL